MPILNQSGPKTYVMQGATLPSVTAILAVTEKRYLDSWRHKVGRAEADAVTQRAAVFGTALHVVAQRIAKGEPVKVDAEMEPFADAVRLFLDAHVKEVLGTEIAMVSRTQGFGGTADMHCILLDGSYALIDWKTSKQLTKSHGHQLAAYALLARERDMKVHKRIAVKIDKQRPGKFHARSFADHTGDVRVFRACLGLWHALDRQKTDPLCNWAPPEVV